MRVTDLLDADWRDRLANYRTLLVGFSGGLDSTVLLHNIASQPSLASKLSAVHIHHGLSSNADAWVAHCQTVCNELSIPLITHKVVLAQDANIEEQARLARLAVFKTLLNENDCLLLGHHREDQAETLLLQLFRGAGIDGLAAMPAVKPFGSGELVRPFLHHSRALLEAYASQHQLNWVDDESNVNTDFSRNYLRHQVMPILRARWPSVATNLARSAAHCQQAKANLNALAAIDSAELAILGNTLSLATLPIQNHARCANVLRAWLTHNEIKLPSTHTFNRLISEVIFASEETQPCVEWNGISIRRYQQTLYILKKRATTFPVHVQWSLFPKPIQWGERGEYVHAVPAKTGLHVPEGRQVNLRTRLGGETFYWHGQTKALKKLLQQWHVPPWLRDTLPLIYIDDELVAVFGAINDKYYGINKPNTYQIEHLSRSIDA